MRRSMALVLVVFVAVVAAGCSRAAEPEPFSSSKMVVLGTNQDAASAPATVPLSPAAIEHIPASERMLVHSAEGTTAVTQARAIQIARAGDATLDGKRVSAVHVSVSSDISRPADPLSSTDAISAWMVTFHGVDVSIGGMRQVGSVTVLINTDTGKVIKKLSYVPVFN